MNPDPTSLDRLHDLVAPPPVPWWPPAPGWIWVLSALAAALLIAALRGFIRWQHHRYRREALAELTRQQTAISDPDQRVKAVAALAELLKRTALSAFPREQVAALTGARWLAFLDRTGATTGFSSATGALLENAAYDPRRAATLDEAQAREAVELTRHWIVHHQTRETK
jgi:hypothetical protein